MKRQQSHSGRRWRTFGLMLVLSLGIISILQQPAGSPPARSRDGAEAKAGEEMSPSPRREPTALSEGKADEAAKTIVHHYPVKSVEVAVKYDMALIAVIPEGGLSPEEHRRLERTIAEGTTIDGVREVIVTTDPAMHDSIRRLGQTRRDVERRVGTRMTESHILWAKEFDEVATQIQNLGSHARRIHPAAAAGRIDP